MPAELLLTEVSEQAERNGQVLKRVRMGTLSAVESLTSEL